MRVDDNRPSGAEQAAQDDKKKQNVKNKDPALTSQSGQQAGRTQQVKEVKSPFDLVLENLSNPQNPSQAEALKFDMKVKDALSDRDQGRDRDKTDKKRDKDEDKKASSGEEKEVGRGSREGIGRDKVLGKQDMGGQTGGGSGSSGDSGGSASQQFGQRSFKSGPMVRTDVAAPSVQEVQKMETPYALKAAERIAMREIPKAVLDQIVQHVRIGFNKNLDKEIQLDLSDRVFRGLSLKVSSRQGKIDVTFLTGNPDVRRLFESQKREIAQALGEKGISVSQIRVQFLG